MIEKAIKDYDKKQKTRKRPIPKSPPKDLKSIKSKNVNKK
jgi:hypothetical protein